MVGVVCVVCNVVCECVVCKLFNEIFRKHDGIVSGVVGWWGGGYLPLWLAQNKGIAQPAALFFSVCVCPTAMFLLLCLGHHRPVGQIGSCSPPI